MADFFLAVISPAVLDVTQRPVCFADRKKVGIAAAQIRVIRSGKIQGCVDQMIRGYGPVPVEFGHLLIVIRRYRTVFILLEYIGCLYSKMPKLVS